MDNYVASRYWEHRLHAPLREPGDVNDAGAGVLLRRARRTKKCAGHHDAELRLDGLDHGLVVGLWILDVLLGRSEKRDGFFWNHRQLRLGGRAWHHARNAFAIE